MSNTDNSPHNTIGSEGELPEGFTRLVQGPIYRIRNAAGTLVEVGLIEGVGLSEAGEARLRELGAKKSQQSMTE